MPASAYLPHDWFPAPLPANLVSGAGSWIYSSFAFLHYRSARRCGVNVGHDTGIYNGTFFDLGPEAEVVIGEYCAIVGAIISTNGYVEIGDYSFIAHEVVIADSCLSLPWGGRKGKTAGNPPTGSKVVIGRNVWIGARAILLGGARVGEGSIVGAAAVVDYEVPPYSVVVGNPSRVVGEVRR